MDLEDPQNLKAANGRLDGLNGSIARQEQKLNEIDTYRHLHEKDGTNVHDNLEELTVSVTKIQESMKLAAKA